MLEGLKKRLFTVKSINGVEFKDTIGISSKLDIALIKKVIEKKLPKAAFSGLNGIYFVDHDIFQARSINAYYDRERKVIYLSDMQESEEDCINDIIHETSHFLQEKYGQHIFMDGELKKEFIHKRKVLARQLHLYGMPPPPSSMIVKTEFDSALDNYFFKEVGYKKLKPISSGIYMTIYSCTSLEEYYAEGFEYYFCKPHGPLKIKKYCPVLYQCLKRLEKELYK